ncbi:MAG: hypothetical protein NUW01_00420 [Gemmatimonadaceae bacterium]|nr:hypothetical protein [Gemmatimonadaceae bacterium]
MPGLPSVAASSQAWASVGSMWSTSLNEAWLPEWVVGSTGGFTVPCEPSSSGYIFSSSGDGTTGSGNSFYALGRAVRIVQGASTIYGPVASASVAVGVTTVGLSSSLATAALSTATAFTSVAVGTESGHSLAGSSGLGATKFHREDGTWAAATGTITRNITVPVGSALLAVGTPGWLFGGGNYRLGAWEFVDAAVERIVCPAVALPEDYLSGALVVKLHWGTFSGGAGNVVWRVYLNARGTGDSLVATTDESSPSDTIAAPGTDNVYRVSTHTATVTPTAGDIITISVERTGNAGADTLGGSAALFGVEIEYTASQ